MTMPFLAPAGAVPPGLKKGDRIRFEFTARPDGQFRVTKLVPAEASGPDHGAHK
jgi:Cu/Ag efflux protein CusF